MQINYAFINVYKEKLLLITMKLAIQTILTLFTNILFKFSILAYHFFFYSCIL